MARTAHAALAATIALLVFSCRLPQRLPECVEEAPAGEGTPQIETGGDPVLLAAGDIVGDSLGGAEATARLLDERDGMVATLGDNLNTRGRLEDALLGYSLSWGRHRWRTRPSIGNHDMITAHGAGYYAYFCSAAGTPFDGWYSYDLAAWHVVVLNSMCAERYGDGDGPACDEGSAQLRWLEADLAAHPARCTLAYWHHPRFNTDGDGDRPELLPIWNALYRSGAELVLNGHVHVYERFAPLTPDGVRDDARGIRQLVVGTGGAGLITPPAHAQSEAQIGGALGIARLTLRPESYEWQFIDVDGVVRDEGSSPCH